MKWTKDSKAEKALAGFSFAESSFFPIPVDPLLAAMVSLKPKKTMRFVFIAGVTSVLGGLLGYLIGDLLMDSLGQWILDTYNLHEEFKDLGEAYQSNAFLAVLTAAFTPVPYKIITISAGAFAINLAQFILASIVGRFARFALVGWFSSIVGEKYKDKVEYFINLLSLAIIA